MRILVICQYYFPEPFRISDICEEMGRRGHELMVVTGEPNYPEGVIYNGYEHHQKSDEIINSVRVHRCPIIPRKTGSIYRLLNYYSYSFSATQFVLSANCVATDGKPFDVVFVNQLSPVMMAKPAIAYKKKYGVPIVMYCLDLWPESLIAGGIKRDSMIYKYFHRVSKKIYSEMDSVFITSRMFKGYLKNEFEVKDNVISYLPQYAEGIFTRLPFKIPGEITNLVFAGNIGEVQSVETILKAAEILKNRSVHFHIVGGGTNLERLKGLSNGLKNVTFYGRRPVSEMPFFYSIADAMLITLKADPILSLTLPGKVQSYMAAGKPMIGAINGETAVIIKEANCGYCGKADDADGLVKNICRFIDDDNKKQMGLNARLFYEKYFARKKFMDHLEQGIINACTS